MSRTYKDESKRRRIVKNSYYEKILHIWGEDFRCKRKDRSINKLARVRQKRNDRKEVKDENNF